MNIRKKKKIKKKKITIEIPETVYFLIKKATIARNTTIDLAKDSLTKISDIMREALVDGLVKLKEIRNEADKRLKEKAKNETKQMNKNEP